MIRLCGNLKTLADFFGGNFDSGTISELQNTALLLNMINK